jgi:hypothetical protein
MEQQAGHLRALPMDRLAAEHRSILGTKPFPFFIYFLFSIEQINNRSSNPLPPFILFLPMI